MGREERLGRRDWGGEEERVVVEGKGWEEVCVGRMEERPRVSVGGVVEEAGGGNGRREGERKKGKGCAICVTEDCPSSFYGWW